MRSDLATAVPITCSPGFLSERRGCRWSDSRRPSCGVTGAVGPNHLTSTVGNLPREAISREMGDGFAPESEKHIWKDMPVAVVLALFAILVPASVTLVGY
jgi:hypothetical protein